MKDFIGHLGVGNVPGSRRGLYMNTDVHEEFNQVKSDAEQNNTNNDGEAKLSKNNEMSRSSRSKLLKVQLVYVMLRHQWETNDIL